MNITSLIETLSLALAKTTAGEWKVRVRNAIYSGSKEIAMLPIYWDKDVDQACANAAFITLAHNLMPEILAALKRVGESKEEFKGCGICGGALVKIRGRYPKTPRREICPTCAVERLEDICDFVTQDFKTARAASALPAPPLSVRETGENDGSLSG